MSLLRRSVELRVTPWRWAKPRDGLWQGYDGQLWLYRVLPTVTVGFEDASVRLSHGERVRLMLAELGRLARPAGAFGAVGARGQPRRIHVVAAVVEAPPPIPPTTAGQHAHLAEVFDGLRVPQRVVFVGVRLVSGLARAETVRETVIRTVQGLVGDQFAEEPDLTLWSDDALRVATILENNGCHKPTLDEVAILESWHTDGRIGPELIVPMSNHLLVARDGSLDNAQRIEMLDLAEVEEIEIGAPPHATWAQWAFAHEAGPSVISIRADLVAASDVRRLFRRREMAVINDMRDDAKKGRLERPEDDEALALLRNIETRYSGDAAEPALVRGCVTFGLAVPDDRTSRRFIDDMYAMYGLRLRHRHARQHQALWSTLPCGPDAIQAHGFTLDAIAHAGLNDFAELGDGRGICVGLTRPDGTPVYLDPDRARSGPPKDGPRSPAGRAPSQSPIVLVVGNVGSGKAQPYDSRVLTPGGWSRMGDLRVGDLVIGSDGAAHRVTAVYERGRRPVYQVVCSDGATTRACGEHLWALLGRESPVSTEELARLVAGRPRPRLPLVAPVELDGPTPDGDPWVAGMALVAGARVPGGCRLRVRREHVAELVRRSGATVEEEGGTWTTCFVPGDPPNYAAYLRAPLSVRAELLRGAVDRAGYVARNATEAPCLRIATDRPEVVDDVVELVRSLGGVAVPTASRSPSTAQVHLSVRVPASVLDAVRGEPIAGAPERRVVEVVPDGMAETRCILVDTPDHLYVTDSYILTHNTFLIQDIAYQALLAGHRVVFVNGKVHGALNGFHRVVEESGIPVQRVLLGTGASQQGVLDPFRFLPKEDAIVIGRQFIESVFARPHIKDSFGTEETTELSAGLRLAIANTEEPVRSLGDAVRYVRAERVRGIVLRRAESDPLFGLGVGVGTVQPWPDTAGLLLIEFAIPLFSGAGRSVSEMNVEELIRQAVMSLVVQAATAILGRDDRGGLVVVDEAAQFINSPLFAPYLEDLGRTGRSRGVTPILGTQLVSDVSGPLESFSGRVFLMGCAEPDEARRGLRMVGLEPTDGLVSFVQGECPPQRRGRRTSSISVLRDMAGRVGQVEHCLTPPWLASAFSTSKEEQ